jgi:hypothetical protein
MAFLIASVETEICGAGVDASTAAGSGAGCGVLFAWFLAEAGRRRTDESK